MYMTKELYIDEFFTICSQNIQTGTERNYFARGLYTSFFTLKFTKVNPVMFPVELLIDKTIVF